MVICLLGSPEFRWEAVMQQRLLGLISIGLLAACATSGPPPLDPSTLPPTQESENWKDWGPEQNAARGMLGTKMSGDQIRSRLTGRVLSGCFPDGSRFSEILADDGAVLQPQSGEQLATYRVDGDKLCFTYPRQAKACYRVSYDQRGLYFYRNGSEIAASTVCPIPN